MWKTIQVRYLLGLGTSRPARVKCTYQSSVSTIEAVARHNTSQGFTTIELIMALLVLGTLIPLAGAGINLLTVTNNRARDLALANMLAQNKVELLRSAGYNSINLGTTDFSSELPSELGAPKSGNYTVTSPSDGIKEVVVTITYDDYKRSRTLQYKSLVSELGVAQ